MGSICSCFCVDDLGEYRNSYGSVHGQCTCFRFLVQQVMHMYTLILQGENHSPPPSSLGCSASTREDSFSSTSLSTPRSLPYDDPRCSRLCAGGPTTGHDKPLIPLDEESEALRSVKNDCRTESLSIDAKCKEYNNVASRRGCSIEITSQMAYIFPSSEEEDVCPTCLEEYTCENPRIVLQCSHHFHLGCIYEWIERSELCPFCGKVMVFNEAT